MSSLLASAQTPGGFTTRKPFREVLPRGAERRVVSQRKTIPMQASTIRGKPGAPGKSLLQTYTRSQNKRWSRQIQRHLPPMANHGGRKVKISAYRKGILYCVSTTLNPGRLYRVETASSLHRTKLIRGIGPSVHRTYYNAYLDSNAPRAY